MKHGVAFRKLSRTSSHRMLMLRNLVSSLLEHEQIKTTLPKAKETARLAEKILSLGKKGDLPAQRQAAAFLLVSAAGLAQPVVMLILLQNSDKTLPLLFGSYAERYKNRPGGYTRIHKFGYRKGDHAPHAIIELCDNPRDIKFELTARAVGRQTVQRWLQTGGAAQADNVGEYSTLADRPWIRDITKVNYTQLMKFASEDRKLEFENKAIDWANHLLAEAETEGGLRRPAEPDPKKPVPGLTVKHVGKRQRAGERLTGLEDYAAEMILHCLQSAMSRVPIYVDAALLSGYVLLKFPAEDLTEDQSSKSLEEALELCRSGKVPCIFAAYVCVEDVTLDNELRDDLRRDWRAEDLRKNEESRRVEKRRPWGARPGPDDRPRGRGHHRRGGELEPTEAEHEFLRTAESMVKHGHTRLSAVLRVANPLISRYTFRATLKNPQHLVPFPILSTTRIEKALGESVSTWLDSTEVENIHDWQELCHNASNHADPFKSKLGRLWKVDLKSPEVEVVLHLLSVPPSPQIRSINPIDQAPPYPGHSPRPEFPVTIRLILSIRVPGIAPASGRQGRTALSPVTAQLLVSVIPGFSPFMSQIRHPLVLLDPCSGTGSIPHAASAVSRMNRQRTLVLCGDILAHNVESALSGMVQGGNLLEGLVWAAEEVESGLRPSTVDAVVSGEITFRVNKGNLTNIFLQDLPWGHRECTPNRVAKLYPRFLKAFGNIVKTGGYAVLTSASAPLMRRCLSSSKLWEIVGVGGEGSQGPREVWIGGMRVTVFLLRREDVLAESLE
ncbi:hypothetical protein FRC01_004055 [Tulasnella sp. 417]|nr:hypothetical protein FRC01_004055 [Tulasnella sp. 417]